MFQDFRDEKKNCFLICKVSFVLIFRHIGQKIVRSSEAAGHRKVWLGRETQYGWHSRWPNALPCVSPEHNG